MPKLIKEKGSKKVCVMYQDDEFGLEVLRGGEAGLKTVGMEFAEKTSYKRGATDFSSQIQRLQAAGCDFIALGTIIRETIGAIATARRLGYNPTFMGSSASYTDLIHKLGGPAMNGLYATMGAQHPYQRAQHDVQTQVDHEVPIPAIQRRVPTSRRRCKRSPPNLKRPPVTR